MYLMRMASKPPQRLSSVQSNVLEAEQSNQLQAISAHLDSLDDSAQVIDL